MLTLQARPIQRFGFVEVLVVNENPTLNSAHPNGTQTALMMHGDSERACLFLGLQVIKSYQMSRIR